MARGYRGTVTTLLMALVGEGCGLGHESYGDGTDDASGVMSLDGPVTAGGVETGLSTGLSEDSSATMGPANDPHGDSDDETGPPSSKFDLGELPEPLACDEGTGNAPFSYIWIANSPEGTVSKIDTHTGIELGRYYVSDGSNSPSRTSVNQVGDVAVANRGNVGSLTKIAASIDDCIDLNMDGVIQTSTGAEDLLTYAEDECVLWNTPLPSSGYDRGPRAVAWEGGEIDPVTCLNTVPDPRVWVSWRGDGNTIEVRRLDGQTGEVLDATTAMSGGGRTYGGAVNADGDFWIATRGGQDNLIHIDGVSLAANVYDVPAGDNYGMAVDKNGDPWVVTYNEGDNYVYRFDVASSMFVTVASSDGRFRGIQIDRQGRAWIAGNNPCRLSLVDTDNEMLIDDAIELPGCGTPVGTSIDRDGYVWVVDQGVSDAFKIDPETHSVVQTVSGLVQPYTYSDMTGSGLNLVVNPPG